MVSGPEMKLYLASTSPRRCELLGRLGVPFEIIAPSFEEKPTNLPPQEEALYFAEEKARSVAVLCPASLIIGSDTLIDFEGKKLGKPKDATDAKAMLQALSGKSHSVISAVALLDTKTDKMKSVVEQAKVYFKTLNEGQIDDYVATGEPLDKAGAYAIQGMGRSLIAHFEGQLETIIGLPIHILKKWL